VKSHWVEHKGKRVFIADYSEFGVNSFGLNKEAKEIIETLSKEPADSVPSISKVDGTSATKDNVKILMDLLSVSKKYVTKRCVVGVTGIRWTFLDAFNRLAGRSQFESFDTMEKALDWIVQD